MTRIQQAPGTSSHLTLWLGLLGVVVVGAIVFFIQTREPKHLTGEAAYLKPVPSEARLRSRLSKEQYHVMRENGTEALFHNQYYENQSPGLYVDFITGEPLFNSVDKFDSGMGLPSFTKPLSKEHVVLKRDTSFGLDRIEVRANKSNSHLGHFFNDGPAPTHERYTVNSASLHFVPVEKLQKEGYGEFLPLFEQKK
jgi:peptide-methionine (R)-S-oxide reductase